MSQHLQNLRKAEAESLRDHFKAGSDVLEIGGADGYQASLLAGWGCQVTAIDIGTREMPSQFHHPVLNYDGVHIPLPSRSCDLVFSSNVLEHVEDLDGLFVEIKRVLRAGGVIIHVLPSPAWRLWTSLSHYGYVMGKIVRRRSQSTSATEVAPTVSDAIARHGLLNAVRRSLVAGAHGEYPNAWSELYYFSRRRWLKVFRQGGFSVTTVSDTQLFYTGYGLFSGLSLEARQMLARLLGPACNVFVMRVDRIEDRTS